jgi:hypothetical protein
MWLLLLYPRAWRQRYGEEMAELLRTQNWSPSLVLDLVVGAIDARLNPQRVASADQHEIPQSKERYTMFATMMRLHCTGHGPNLTAREQWASTAVMLGSMMVLTIAWMWLTVTYRDPSVRQYILSFSQLPYFAGLIIAMPLKSLKGRPRATQAIFMSASLAVLIAWCVLVGFVASQI